MIKKWLKIKPDETKLVYLNLLQSFLLGIPRTFTLAAADALFLKYFQAAQLPYAYIGRAILIPLLGIIIFQFEKRLKLVRLLKGILFFILITLFLSWFMFFNGYGKWIALFLVIWVSTEWTLTGVVYWNTASMLFNVRQAKRLFGLISSGEVIAGIFGGWLILSVVKSIGTYNLLWFSMAGIFLSYLNLMIMNRRYHKNLARGTVTSPKIKNKLKISSLFKQKYFLSIFMFVSLYYFAYYFTDNAFYDRVAIQFKNSEDIAAFLGKYLSILAILVFLFKTFITGSLIKRLGIGFASMSTAFVVLIGAILVLITSVFNYLTLVFWMMALTKLLERLFTESVYRPVYYTYYQVIGEKTRNRVQNFTESVVGRVAGGLAGLVLLLLNLFFSFSAIEICVSLLIISLIWAFVSFITSKRYHETIKNSITSAKIKSSKMEMSKNELSALKIRLISKGKAETLFILKILKEHEDIEFKNKMIQSFYDDDDDVRQFICNEIINWGIHIEESLIINALKSEKNIHIKFMLIQILGSYKTKEVEKYLIDLLESKNISEQCAAISSVINNFSRHKLKAQKLLDKKINSMNSESRKWAVKTIYYIKDEYRKKEYEQLYEDPSIDVKIEMLPTLLSSNNQTNWKLASDYFFNHRLKFEAYQHFLKKGAEALPFLKEVFDKSSEIKIKKMILSLFTFGKNEEHLEFLKKQVKNTHPEIREEALTALIQSQFIFNQFSEELIFKLIHYELKFAGILVDFILSINFTKHYEKELLLEALNQLLRKTKKRLFYLLIFLYPESITLEAWFFYSSGIKEKKANVIEILEGVLHSKIKKTILALFDDEQLKENAKYILPAHNPMLKEQSNEIKLKKYSRYFLNWDNSWLKSCILYFYYHQDKKMFKWIVESYDFSDDTLVSLVIKNLKISDDTLFKKIAKLSEVSIFKQIPMEFLSEIFLDIQEKTFKEDKIVFDKGDLGNTLYIIAKGEVEVLSDNVQLARLKEGNFFGEFAALSPGVRSASIKTTTKTTLYSINQKLIFRLIQTYQDVSRSILNTLCERVIHRVHDLKKAKKLSEIKIIKNKKYLKNMSKVDMLLLLQKNILLKALPVGWLPYFIKKEQVLELNSEQSLFKAGDFENNLYLVLLGQISINYENQQILIKKSGDVVGEIEALGFFEQRNFSANALEPTLLIEIPHPVIQDLLWQNQDFTKNAIDLLIALLRSLI